MGRKSARTLSPWMATAEVPDQAALAENTHADVCIVGAGMAGMTTAYLLAREGKSVVVLDDGRMGGGMTERTTAHLSNAIDSRYFEMERLYGEKGARLAAQSHTAAIDRIEAIVHAEGIDCDFERLDGYLFDPPEDKTDGLERELQAAHRAGLHDVEPISRAPIASFDTGRCLRFPRQAQFHPLKYLTGLCRALKRNNARLFTGTHASKIEGGKHTRVETSNGLVVTAGALVIATNTPGNDIVTSHTRQTPYTTYVIGARIPRGPVTKALYWDTSDPYHYVRVQSVSSRDGDAYDYLIVGGEDHKSGQAEDGDKRHTLLEAWAQERFPVMKGIAFRWSGQVMESFDGIAFIGRNPGNAQNVYIATGDSGMGMTHGTISGILITDAIMGRDCPWTQLYDPSRKTLRAFRQYATENINVAAQVVQDYLTDRDFDSPDEIRQDEGAVARSD